jgi:hypothetical protein
MGIEIIIILKIINFKNVIKITTTKYSNHNKFGNNNYSNNFNNKKQMIIIVLNNA